MNDGIPRHNERNRCCSPHCVTSETGSDEDVVTSGFGLRKTNHHWLVKASDQIEDKDFLWVGLGQGRWQMKCEENIKKIINKHLIKVISVWLDAQEASRETWALTLIDPRFLQKDDLAWHDPCYDMGCCSPLVIAIKLNQKYQKTDLGCNRHPRKGWPGMVHATTRDVDHPPKKWNVQCKQKHLIFSITPMLMCM